MMYKNLLLIIFALTFVKANATWTQITSYPGGGPTGNISFAINGKGYVGCGIDNSFIVKKDFWEYDPVLDTWTQKADVGNDTRYGACGFAIGSKGYVCLGWALLNSNALKDLWEYDPSSNVWTQKTDFPGTARYTASEFVLYGKAYVGLGYSPLKSDFYEYDPATDTWTQLTNSFGGGARQTCTSFSCTFVTGGNTVERGYITQGNANGSLFSDLWEFTPGQTPGSGTWTQKSSPPTTPRMASFAFSILDKGYLGAGLNPGTSTEYSQVYRYDPPTDTWTLIDTFPGINKDGARAFAINNVAYVGGGRSAGVFYPDFYSYIPPGVGINELNEQSFVLINSSKNLQFKFKDERTSALDVVIYTTEGKTIFERKYSSHEELIIDLQKYSSGIYYYTLREKSGSVISGKFFL